MIYFIETIETERRSLSALCCGRAAIWWRLERRIAARMWSAAILAASTRSVLTFFALRAQAGKDARAPNGSCAFLLFAFGEDLLRGGKCRMAEPLENLHRPPRMRKRFLFFPLPHEGLGETSAVAGD